MPTVLAPPSQDQSILLSLPAELRVPIYTFILTLPTCRKLIDANDIFSDASRGSSGASVISSATKAPPNVTAILTTCRLTAEEASPLLYSLNTFTAHSTLMTSLPSPLLSPSHKILNPVHVRNIRKWHIHVRLDVDPRFTEEQVTAAFTGCEELTVDCTEAMFRSAGCGVVLLFAGVRDVGRVKIRGGGVDDGVRDWLQRRMRKPIGWEGDGKWWESAGADVWARRGMDRSVVGDAGGTNAGASSGYEVWTHGNR